MGSMTISMGRTTYDMFVQGNRKVVAHADDMIQKICHPEDPASLFDFKRVSALRRVRAALVDGGVNLMIPHSLHQAKGATSAHPCLPVICPHRLKCGN